MLINEATHDYISRHADDNPRQLALKGTKNPEVDLAFALDQIAGRQTARQKLPTWAATDGIVYPPHLAMEQCSSEQTARYKASLITHHTTLPLQSEGVGGRLSYLDLTGGLGVDFSFMARHFSQSTYVERQPALCDIARHNFALLGLESAQVVCGDGVDFLRHTDQHFDWVYIDPARRDSHGGRTYAISDCTPNVLDLLSLLREKADHVLLKLSPMLDWRKAVRDIGEPYVSEVHIVAVGNECKELLINSRPTPDSPSPDSPTPAPSPTGEGRLVCVNDNDIFETTLYPNTKSPLPFRGGVGGGGSFLYIPNPAIMKAGCFAELCERYGVQQLSQNSHLFIFADFIEKFPGRKFRIDSVSTLNKREIREKLQGLKQANITVRNFPLTAAELRKRLKLSDGGDTYIFATTLADDSHVLLLCHKV